METGCKLVAVLTLLTNVPHNCFAQKGSCNKVTSCKCAYDDGAIVDLTQTASTDGTAKFTDISGKVATTLYSWNPCTSFTEGTCENVAVCQIQEDLPPAIYTPVGSQDSAVFTTDDDGNLAIKYQSEQRGVLRTTLITLTCYEGSAENFEVKDGRATEAEYFMEFTSQFACPIVVTADHLSVGTYIIIIFSSIALSFFIVGIMVQKFVRKKSGKNVIPFVEFWVQLPGLVKAGVLLIVCRGKHFQYDNV